MTQLYHDEVIYSVLPAPIKSYLAGPYNSQVRLQAGMTDQWLSHLSRLLGRLKNVGFDYNMATVPQN